MLFSASNLATSGAIKLNIYVSQKKSLIWYRMSRFTNHEGVAEDEVAGVGGVVVEVGGGEEEVTTSIKVVVVVVVGEETTTIKVVGVIVGEEEAKVTATTTTTIEITATTTTTTAVITTTTTTTKIITTDQHLNNNQNNHWVNHCVNNQPEKRKSKRLPRRLQLRKNPPKHWQWRVPGQKQRKNLPQQQAVPSKKLLSKLLSNFCRVWRYGGVCSLTLLSSGSFVKVIEK